MVEGHMLAATLSRYEAPKPSLIKHLRGFGVVSKAEAPEAEARKDEMRRLVLERREWSDAEFASILDYCWSDVAPLPDLLDRIVAEHARLHSPWLREHALQRGEYLKASAILQHRSRGIPVDVPWLNRIFRHRDAIRARLAEECNRYYGYDLYRRVHKTVSVDPVTRVRNCEVSYSFQHAGLESYLLTQPFSEEWPRTETGRLKLDADTLDDLAKDWRCLKEFERTKATLAQLNNTGLLDLLTEDGHIRAESVPFWTKTGRNQPMASKGFLFNLPPWLRSIIRPKPGWVLLQADWRKQEPGIAVALSGDAKMAEAYRSKDLYLTLAKLAGAVAEDADPAAPHTRMMRQSFKALVLGLGFGMGKKGLARRLYADLNGGDEKVITREEARDRASELYDWHKGTFTEYWEYLEDRVREAHEEGHLWSQDGWVYFVEPYTRETQLLNYDMQSNGAVMLREAVKILAYETDLDVVASLHDAIYIQCREEDAEEAGVALVRAMQRAARKVVGEAVEIGVGLTLYTHEEGYRDSRGDKTLEIVRRLLDEIDANPLALMESVPPKPRKPRAKKPANDDVPAQAGGKEAA
jgi:ATP-dependent protease HslVU (ClpYQ) peptidase subunit